MRGLSIPVWSKVSKCTQSVPAGHEILNSGRMGLFHLLKAMKGPYDFTQGIGPSYIQSMLIGLAG